MQLFDEIKHLTIQFRNDWEKLAIQYGVMLFRSYTHVDHVLKFDRPYLLDNNLILYTDNVLLFVFYLEAPPQWQLYWTNICSLKNNRNHWTCSRWICWNLHLVDRKSFYSSHFMDLYWISARILEFMWKMVMFEKCDWQWSDFRCWEVDIYRNKYWSVNMVQWDGIEIILLNQFNLKVLWISKCHLHLRKLDRHQSWNKINGGTEEG